MTSKSSLYLLQWTFVDGEFDCLALTSIRRHSNQNTWSDNHSCHFPLSIVQHISKKEEDFTMWLLQSWDLSYNKSLINLQITIKYMEQSTVMLDITVYIHLIDLMTD